MIDKNNLNRIKGILSAKAGAEIPKFLNPGGPLTYNAQDPDFIKFTEFSGDKIIPFSFRYYAALKSLSPNATPQQLAEQLTGLAPLPGNITVSEAVSNYEKNKNISNNSSNNSQSLIETGVPGAPILNPNSAVEAAALDNLTEYMLKREENIKNAVLTQPITNTNIQGVTVPEPASINTDISQLLQKVQTRVEQEADSYAMKLEAEKVAAEKTAARKENWKNFGMQAAGAATAAFENVGNVIGAKQMATDSNTTKTADALYDTMSEGIKKLGPYGEFAGMLMDNLAMAGDIAQELGGGTDLQTKTDQWMDSSFFSWNVGLINGFWGQNSDKFGIDHDTMNKVGSSYGGFINEANELSQNADKKYGLFSSKKRKEINNKLAGLKSLQTKMSDIADITTDQRNYVQSMGEQAGLAYSMMTDGGYNQKYTYAAKQGGLLEWNPTLEIEGEPRIEINWELPAFKEGGNIDIVEELEWIPEFKDGGKTEELDIPETEETSQKNVIPEGALHKNKHHMLHADGLTKKGIPVIDDNGEQQAEIEHSEIIFTLEVTKKLEEYYKIFYSDESSNKEKELAALDAGKLLVYQILENTEDRTGLIESCKKGGTLTIKESEVVEDLLNWVPTIMIVEEVKEEIEEEKPKKKSELEKDDLKELVKDVIREALIELLIK